MDLTLEARNLQRLQANFADWKVTDRTFEVKFPQPKEGWVSRGVLVEEFMQGENSIDTLMNLPESTRLMISETVTKMVLEMVLNMNFLHGDLHPGNVLVQPGLLMGAWGPFISGTAGNQEFAHSYRTCGLRRACALAPPTSLP